MFYKRQAYIVVVLHYPHWQLLVRPLQRHTAHYNGEQRIFTPSVKVSLTLLLHWTLANYRHVLMPPSRAHILSRFVRKRLIAAEAIQPAGMTGTKHCFYVRVETVKIKTKVPSGIGY